MQVQICMNLQILLLSDSNFTLNKWRKNKSSFHFFLLFILPYLYKKLWFCIDNIGNSEKEIWNSIIRRISQPTFKIWKSDLNFWRSQILLKDALEYREVSVCLEIRFRCVPLNAVLINVRYKFTSEKGSIFGNFCVNK